jgi:pyruvate formate lyase activating enzyme
MNTHKALLWEPLENKQVRCSLCGHRCLIVEGAYGACRVRENLAGELRTHNYSSLAAVHVDPIEKKPLFHFLPGSTSLSIAAVGCNFQCSFCQNWQISQAPRDGHKLGGQDVTPELVVQAAQRHHCQSISYTYTEPTVFFEYAMDVAALARQHRVRNVFVSNGYMTAEAVAMIAPVLDAANVDLKAFRDETYKRVMRGTLEPVLACLRELVRRGVWVEVTTLVVPGMNDSAAELRDIAGFIAGELGTAVPWHVSRFHGDYQMTSAPPTPVETLREAYDIGKTAGLEFVYCGNIPGEAENTTCPGCGDKLIERRGFAVQAMRVVQGRCPKCARGIAGVWDA